MTWKIEPVDTSIADALNNVAIELRVANTLKMAEIKKTDINNGYMLENLLSAFMDAEDLKDWMVNGKPGGQYETDDT